MVVRRYYSEDWRVLETVRQCDICGRSDIVHITNSVEFCPICAKNANFNWNTQEMLMRVTAIGSSQCHVC